MLRWSFIESKIFDTSKNAENQITAYINKWNSHYCFNKKESGNVLLIEVYRMG